MSPDEIMPIEEMPRSVEELRAFTRFKLKAMMKKAGMFGDPAVEAAISAMSISNMAEQLANHLAALDGPKAVASPQATPQPTAAPAQAASAAAPAAPAPRRGRPPKNPRPEGETPPPALVASAVAQSSPPPALPAGPAPSLTPALPSIDPEMIRQIVREEVTRVLDVVRAESTTRNAAAEGNHAVVMRTLALVQALSLYFAEETLGGSRQEIIDTAVTDIPAIEGLVGKALAK